jgi:hypothetical protein
MLQDSPEHADKSILRMTMTADDDLRFATTGGPPSEGNDGNDGNDGRLQFFIVNVYLQRSRLGTARPSLARAGLKRNCFRARLAASSNS